MVRDRLAELKNRSGLVVDDKEMEKMNVESTKNDEISLNSFLKTLGTISVEIDKIIDNTQEIQKIQGLILNSTRIEDELYNKLDNLTTETKNIGRNIQKTLKREQDEISKSKSNKKMNSDLQIRKIQINCQSKRFFEVWSDYNLKQSEFRDKNKKLLVQRCKIVNNNFTDEEIENMLDERNTGIFATSVLDQEKIARQQLRDLECRHDALIKMESNIKEVHDMFMEISYLVNQQGQVIDRIELDTENAQNHIQHGTEQLDEGKKKFYSRLKKKMCLMSFGGAIAVLVTLVLIVVTVI